MVRDSAVVYPPAATRSIKDNTITGNISNDECGGTRCDGSSPTISSSTIGGNSSAGLCGGILSVGRPYPIIVNCISWNNELNEITEDFHSYTTVRCSNVRGGYSGEGNISADPLFVLKGRGDYWLCWGSPCIDAGDAGFPFDRDGMRADMGASFFGQPKSFLCVRLLSSPPAGPGVKTPLKVLCSALFRPNQPPGRPCPAGCLATGLPANRRYRPESSSQANSTTRTV